MFFACRLHAIQNRVSAICMLAVTGTLPIGDWTGKLSFSKNHGKYRTACGY